MLGLGGIPETFDGKPVLLNEYGRPILGSDGLPILKLSENETTSSSKPRSASNIQDGKFQKPFA